MTPRTTARRGAPASPKDDPASRSTGTAGTGKTTRAKATTVDEYMAALTADKRVALERLREAILSVAPGAEPCISYDLPAFRVDGKVIAWIGAAARHIAMYGVTGVAPEELAGYDTSGKGTLRFPIDAPLPVSLVQRIVRARMERNAVRR